MKKNIRERGVQLFCILMFIVFVSSCTPRRSISNSGYIKDSGPYHPETNEQFYKGELTEFDVLGISPGEEISEAQIQETLNNHKRVAVKRGAPIMLVQSGAMIPDSLMTAGMEKYYKVSVFSGMPTSRASNKNYSKTLRLAAATGGCEAIVCYWGILETAQKGLATKTVSWVPVVGWGVPDETQQMRIKLKVAVIDVKTGSWDMFSPPPFDHSARSGKLSREMKDQQQVSVLKEKAYISVIDELVKRYAN